MHSPGFDSLPSPPRDRVGWPWTQETAPTAAKAEGGRDWPKISVVTPSYNQGRFIEETIRSVLLQGYPNLEYIVIDGGSTDESVEIIRKYAPWLSHWESQRDRGQSHAINKGLAHCTGEIFNWINSDDLLEAGSLHAVARAWVNAPGAIVAGNVSNFDEKGIRRVVVPTGLTLENFMNAGKARQSDSIWHQPGTFLPLAEVQAAGGVREDLHYVMDCFLMIELLRRCRVVCVPEPLARFRVHGNSKTVVDGFPKFPLEKLGAMRKMKDLYGCVTMREIKAEQVRIFLTCAGIGRRRGAYGEAVRYAAKALGTSPVLVFEELLRRDSFRRFFRKIIQTCTGRKSRLEDHARS
jgi:hypothetical protein